jgi:hypothetical protein
VRISKRRTLLCKSLALARSAISFLPDNPTFNVNGAAEVLKVSAGPGCRFPFGLPRTGKANGHVCFFDITASTLPSGIPARLSSALVGS